MNRGEIRTEVENLIQDSSFDETILNTYINSALLQTSELVFLPSLKRVDTVSTSLGAAYTVLTGLGGGFSGVLRRVVDSSGNIMTIYKDLDMLMDYYSQLNEVGNVETVALEGSTLWYQKIPTVAETLTILYYRNPASLDRDSDEPSDIPEFLQRPLLVNGTAKLVYDVIEDGIEGEKVNTKAQFYLSFSEANKESGITKLRERLAKTRVHHISSFWSE